MCWCERLLYVDFDFLCSWVEALWKSLIFPFFDLWTGTVLACVVCGKGCYVLSLRASQTNILTTHLHIFIFALGQSFGASGSLFSFLS